MSAAAVRKIARRRRVSERVFMAVYEVRQFTRASATNKSPDKHQGCPYCEVRVLLAGVRLDGFTDPVLGFARHRNDLHGVPVIRKFFSAVHAHNVSASD